MYLVQNPNSFEQTISSTLNIEAPEECFHRKSILFFPLYFRRHTSPEGSPFIGQRFIIRSTLKVLKRRQTLVKCPLYKSARDNYVQIKTIRGRYIKLVGAEKS